MTRRWLKLLNPTDFGLPEWVETVRPLSHLADRSVVWDAKCPAETENIGGVFRLRDKARFFRLLRDGDFEMPSLARIRVMPSDPCKVVDLGNGPVLATARGGVSIGDHTSVGLHTSIDRGIYGEYTEIGDRVHIDSHVHIGHSSRIMDRAVIPAGCVIGGWVDIHPGVRLNLGVHVLPHVTIGEGAFVAAGTFVNRDVPPGAIAIGTPMRILMHGGACCSKPLEFQGTVASCRKCHKTYGLKGDEVVPLEEGC